MSFLTHNQSSGSSRGGGGQQKNGAPTKKTTFHFAFICRLKLGTRIKPVRKPQLEVLIHKHGADRYCFPRVADPSEQPNEETVHFRLLQEFKKQCCTGENTPPLTFIQSFPMGGSSLLCVFVLPSVCSSWHPDAPPHHTESIPMNGKPLEIRNGFGWVPWEDFVQESLNQAAIQVASPKNFLICRYGTNCRRKDTCTFVHYDAKQLPPPKNTSITFDNSLVRVGLLLQASIGGALAARLETDYYCLLASACGNECRVFEGSQLSVSYVVDYPSLRFKLKFNNHTAKAPKGFTISDIAAPKPDEAKGTLETQFSLPCGSEQVVAPNSTVEGDGQFAVKGYFSFDHLPVFQVGFRVGKSQVWTRFKLPFFLYRLGSVPDGFDPNGPSNTVQQQVGQYYGSLPETSNTSFRVPFSGESSAMAELVSRLKRLHVPVTTEFAINGAAYVSVVMVLHNFACVILLDQKRDPEDNEPILTVTARHTNQSLFNSLAEVIAGLAAQPAGVTESLLNAPAFV